MDVSVYYDPMISKLIVHGDDRAQALQKLIAALKNYQIAGVPSNVEFLIKCAEHPVFGEAGAINTGFLEDYADSVKVVESERPPAMAQAVGTFAAMMHLERRRGQAPLSTSPWSSHQGSWRVGGISGRATRLLHLDGESPGSILCISNTDGSMDVQIEDGGDDVYHIAGSFGSDTTMEVIVNHTQRIQLTTALKEDADAIHVCMWPRKLPDHMWEVVLKHPYAPSTSDATAAVTGEGSVKAPMPGKISRLEKQVGDTVEEGDVVLVMEAMKMEHGIRAPMAGVLSEIHYKENDIVADGVVLLTVDAVEAEAA
jgi:3-methylcrotonyl-CoA carboxylase alpha subunit